MEGTPKQEILTGYDLMIVRFDHAIDALDHNDPLSEELLKLTSTEKDPEVVDIYLRKNELMLSPTQKEFLQASLAIKTWGRNRDTDPGLNLAKLREKEALSALDIDEPLGEEIFNFTLKEHNPDTLDAYLRRIDEKLNPAQREYLQACIALETKKMEFN